MVKYINSATNSGSDVYNLQTNSTELFLQFAFKYGEDEDRFIAIGISYYSRELMVSYCYRTRINSEEVIRIISSRKATENERRDYYERRV